MGANFGALPESSVIEIKNTSTNGRAILELEAKGKFEKNPDPVYIYSLYILFSKDFLHQFSFSKILHSNIIYFANF